MTYKEYKAKLVEIEALSKKLKQDAAVEFAKANNTVKVGDVFTDHIGKIKVEKIGVYLSMGVPSCIYTGLELKKDGTPTKKGTKRTGYQINTPGYQCPE